MKWIAYAPANIALIKYMGKEDHTQNFPSNPSLSYTLDHLRSYVELETSTASEDQWEPMANRNDFRLTPNEQKRFLNHLAFIKNYFNYTGTFYLRSANDFPTACGLASSASSFAALTKCAVNALCEIQNKPLLSLKEISSLSRQGSGSSCRSLFYPYALWQYDYAEEITLPYPDLLHMTVVVTQEQKKVSSSMAHRLVTQSLLFDSRPKRATLRLEQLLSAFQDKNWHRAYEIVWQEFWDMHALFETTTPSFGYLSAASLTVLALLRQYWENNHDGPLITMDAGPNIHLLFRPDQQSAYQEIAELLKPHYTLFTPCLT